MFDADELQPGQLSAVASVYHDVLAIVGETAMTRSARAEILSRLIADASIGKLDAFVSRERALATVLRHQRSLPVEASDDVPDAVAA